MAYVTITKITKGAKGTSKYNPEQLDYLYVRNVGLTKYSAWLSDLKVGESIIVPYKEIDNFRKKGKGVFEIELSHPKYANYHVGTDVYPYEIVQWISETIVIARRMLTKGCTFDGYCEEYISDPNAETITLREHKNGALYAVGTKSCPFILSNEPYYFRDPTF